MFLMCSPSSHSFLSFPFLFFYYSKSVYETMYVFSLCFSRPPNFQVHPSTPKCNKSQGHLKFCLKEPVFVCMCVCVFLSSKRPICTKNNKVTFLSLEPKLEKWVSQKKTPNGTTWFHGSQPTPRINCHLRNLRHGQHITHNKSALVT